MNKSRYFTISTEIITVKREKPIAPCKEATGYIDYFR